MMRILQLSIGIALAVLIISVAARGQRLTGAGLIAPDEKAWFDRQPPTSKSRIIDELRSAKACIVKYAAQDGVKDARVAAKISRPKFYSGVSNGVHVYRTVPGIKECSPALAGRVDEGNFRELPEAYSGPPRILHLQERCAEAASRYAVAFNRTLAIMRPDALRAACPAGELEPAKKAAVP